MKLKLMLKHEKMILEVEEKELHVTNKNKLRSFKGSGHINEKMDGPYRGFDYKSIFSDPLDLAK